MHSPDRKATREPTDLKSHANPGDRTDAPVAAQSLAAKLGITPRLSDPIPLASIEPNIPYVVSDQIDRILMPGNVSHASWEWAFFGSYNDYPGNVLGVSFNSDPTKTPAKLTLGPPMSELSLYAKGNATSWEYVFFGNSSYSSYPLIQAKAVPSGVNTFSLQYTNGSTTMALCADAGDWNWAFVGATASYGALQLSLRKFFLSQNDLLALLRATWPSANIDTKVFKTGDPDYELMAKPKAQTIFAASGLSGYKWTTDLFDCDDFAYVYKAQARRQAYAEYTGGGGVPARAYACGIVWGRSLNYIHAADVFADYAGNVSVIEPQNGQVVPGGSWVDSLGNPYIPYFIAF